MASAGTIPDAIFAIPPMAAFPRSGRLLSLGRRVRTASGLTIRLLPFVNVQPFKAVTAGLAAFAALVGWAWRHRGRTRVIHCINLTMPPGVFLLLAARLTRSLAVVSLLDVWKPGALVADTWFRRMDFWLQRRLIPHFDGLVVVSSAIAEDFAPGRLVCHIDGGIAPDRFAGAPAVRTATTNRRFRVVLSGTLESYNGIDLARRALAQLSDDVEFVVAGSGTMAGEVREWAERDSRVRYLGFLNFKDVLSLYWSADLLLNLRLTRAMDTRYFFPSKLMELLASGTPVLSTCTGHVETEYGTYLYLLRDETPEALAERIQAIAAIPASERLALGARARAFMVTHKTWPVQAGKLLHYLRRDVIPSASPAR
jgi:glycosyltransferase involved in cell wall biosynthesis